MVFGACILSSHQIRLFLPIHPFSMLPFPSPFPNSPFPLSSAPYLRSRLLYTALNGPGRGRRRRDWMEPPDKSLQARGAERPYRYLHRIPAPADRHSQPNTPQSAPCILFLPQAGPHRQTYLDTSLGMGDTLWKYGKGTTSTSFKSNKNSNCATYHGKAVRNLRCASTSFSPLTHLRGRLGRRGCTFYAQATREERGERGEEGEGGRNFDTALAINTRVSRLSSFLCSERESRD